MSRRTIFLAALGSTLLGAPVASLAQQAWVPGTEITGQAVQIETNGVTNTVHFDPGGVARIQSPGGAEIPDVLADFSCDAGSVFDGRGVHGEGGFERHCFSSQRCFMAC